MSFTTYNKTLCSSIIAFSIALFPKLLKLQMITLKTVEWDGSFGRTSLSHEKNSWLDVYVCALKLGTASAGRGIKIAPSAALSCLI